MLFNERLQLVRDRVISGAKMQLRLVVLPGEIHGLQRAARQSRFNRKQNRSVTIPHIPFGPLKCMQPKAFLSADTSDQSARPPLCGPSGTIPRIPHRATTPNPGQPGPPRFVRLKQF
jgi:hypothetical protein